MSEAQWEQLVMDELAELAWEPKTGKEIAPGSGERESWSELIIPGRLRDAIARINPGFRASAVDEAVADRAVRRHRGMRGRRTSGCTSS